MKYLGLSRRGIDTKIHATCDALGNPTGIHLTPRQAHDLAGADELMETINEADALLADRTYGGDKCVLELLAEGGTEMMIPRKRDRKV